MNVDANRVIAELLDKIRDLTLDNAVLRAALLEKQAVDGDDSVGEATEDA